MNINFLLLFICLPNTPIQILFHYLWLTCMSMLVFMVLLITDYVSNDNMYICMYISTRLQSKRICFKNQKKIEYFFYFLTQYVRCQNCLIDK